MSYRSPLFAYTSDGRKITGTLKEALAHLSERGIDLKMQSAAAAISRDLAIKLPAIKLYETYFFIEEDLDLWVDERLAKLKAAETKAAKPAKVLRKVPPQDLAPKNASRRKRGMRIGDTSRASL